MADGIDIEEHDIMENPAIRKMFPDLTVLKNEIDRNCNNAFESDMFLKKHENLFQEIERNHQIEYVEHTICNLQCINAGNPENSLEDAVEPENKQEIEQNHQIEYVEHTICNLQCINARNPENSLEDAVEPENKLLQCNKIILGSKPNKAAIDENYFENCVKPYQANVVLQDIQPYLQKSKRYCETCEILFPEPCIYESHLHLYHPQRCTSDSSQSKILVKRCYKHKCNVCSEIFESSFKLKTHVEIAHNFSPTQQKHTTAKSNNEIVKQKRIRNYNEKQKKSENNNSDLSNTCFHCKETFETQKSLIEHLYDILKTKRTKTEIVPVLKSVLFRCNKCDIHFVSSEIAANHCDHMEMLINWKCSICYRIFKKEDELSHERQHSVSNNFAIYNLSDLNLNKILFKCSKCSGHFSESKFLSHFRDCGLRTTQLPYCSICAILIDSSLNVSHEFEHKCTDLNINLFTVIETEVISDNPVKPAVKGSQMKKNINKTVETIREVKVVLQRLNTEKVFSQLRSDMEKNPQSDASQWQKIDSLKISKSDNVSPDKTKNDKCNMIKKKSNFVQTKQRTYDGKTALERKQPDNIVHTKLLESKNENPIDFKKLNQAYFYCEDCKCFIPKRGNVKHVQSRCTDLKKQPCKHCGLMLTLTSFRTHKKLHGKSINLKLNDFKFFNLYNGKRITPPVPIYPECNICGVQFVSKTAKNNHICSQEAYLTCHICTIKLSEAAFKLHMMFHNYSLKHSNKVRKITDAVSENNMKLNVNLNDIPIEKSHTENGFKLPTQHICDSSLRSTTPNNSKIIYTCINCNVTVDTYDKVVEHCHGHYNAQDKEIETEICNICSLLIDKTCYLEHQNLHEKEHTIKILTFDSYYFPVENDMWVKHVFKSTPIEKVMEILEKSIYRFEGRIKMDITQQGSHELTVYKCDQCRCFIDPTSLFKHADNSCFKLRKHPCTICGLPFISSASRIDHEKIHKRPGISWKSYRIVVFNREQDKQFNSSICFRKRYILYQCRNCDGIVDKLQSDNHQCNVSDLRKCPECYLLLYAKEFEAHVAEHKEFASFNHRNMKVILLGEVKSVDAIGKKTSKSNYRGFIFDYKMYRCNKCQICIKNEKFIPKHSCHFGKPHSKCPKCDLYFSVSRLKTHLRSHERDPDLLRANMTLIAFDPNSWDQNKNTTTEARTGDSELTDSNDDSDSDIVFKAEENCYNYNAESSFNTKEIVEETAKVYKCACGLHFLNEDSIVRHFGVCKSTVNVSKKKCPKCDLQFTSNILFTHLLAHHSNKNRRYKYDIIEKIK